MRRIIWQYIGREALLLMLSVLPMLTAQAQTYLTDVYQPTEERHYKAYPTQAFLQLGSKERIRLDVFVHLRILAIALHLSPTAYRIVFAERVG